MRPKNKLNMVDSNTILIDKDRVVEWSMDQPVEIRRSGEFKNKAIYLPNRYEWVLGYDSYGFAILVALHPKKSSESTRGSLLKEIDACPVMA